MNPIKQAIDTRMNAIRENAAHMNHRPIYDPKKSTPRCERDEYLDYFHERLKDGYKAKTRKTLTKKYLAVRLSHLKTIQDLHYLRGICEDGERRGKPFSFVFWGSLKPKPEPAIPNTYPDA